MKNVRLRMTVACVTVFLCAVTLPSAFSLTSDEQREWSRKEYAHVPKMPAEMAFYLYRQGKLVLIDAGQPERFKEQHCLGAFNIPEQVAHKVRLKLPLEQIIGVY
ncbi:MAG: hypothetical protein JXB18_04000 [Sedimentisphaerales bacterium]|nr:hypothetical protein [Sedimentisphaerales bacterium]